MKNPIIIGCDEYPKQKLSLISFAEVLGLEKIVYEDGGKSERYTLFTCNGRVVEIRVAGNGYDGGFMGTRVIK